MLTKLYTNVQSVGNAVSMLGTDVFAKLQKQWLPSQTTSNLSWHISPPGVLNKNSVWLGCSSNWIRAGKNSKQLQTSLKRIYKQIDKRKPSPSTKLELWTDGFWLPIQASSTIAEMDGTPERNDEIACQQFFNTHHLSLVLIWPWKKVSTLKDAVNGIKTNHLGMDHTQLAGSIYILSYQILTCTEQQLSLDCRLLKFLGLHNIGDKAIGIQDMLNLLSSHVYTSSSQV